MMPMTAQLLKRFEARRLLAVGSLILAASCFALGKMTPATGEPELFWPLIGRAVGTVLMFLPLSMATLGPIPKREVAQASGFFNLTRQLGGSIGVALLTTLLARRQAFHRNVLVEHVGAIAPDITSRLATLTAGLVAKGYASFEAQLKALKLIDLNVDLQAAVMSFGDTFFATATLVLISLPLILALGKPPKGAKVDMGH
jgi:DHA2 family multidrug resistance protein